MEKIFFLIAFLFMVNSISAQNKNITVYHTGGTKTVVDLANIDSMVIFICGASKVNYGGKDYNTVLIGTQCWFKENLDIGIRIDGNQEQTNNLPTNFIEKYCYGNLESYCDIYGGLYQWDEAMKYVNTEGAQGICPPGWHIPTLAEFQTLATTVENDGNALKREDQGSSGGQGTNTSGFSALLAGYRYYYSGYFDGLGYSAIFSSSTEIYVTNANYLHLYYNDSNIYLIYEFKGIGISVRCVKD